MDQINARTMSVVSPNRNGSISWPEASSIKQNFNLPDSVIYYVNKNPTTPKAYLQMVKSCKYFFEKNSVLVVENIYKNESKLYFQYNYYPMVQVDYITLSSKIWLLSQFDLSLMDYPNFATLLYHRTTEALLYAINMKITMKDFQLLASKFEKFYLLGVKLVDNDGKDMMLEKIVKMISTVKVLYYHFNVDFPATTSSTMKKINKLSNFSHLRKIFLFDIPEIIKVEDLDEFIKNHENTKIWLTFANNISDGYKNQLDALVDTVIASGISHRFIYYNGQNEEKYKIMENRYTV